MGLVLIALNVGLYLTFVLRERLNIPRNPILLFYLFFLIVATVSWISKGPYLELVQLSIYLLGMHLLALLSFKFFFPMVVFHNPTHQEMLKGLFNYILLPIATLGTIVGQIIFLLNAP
ncbi:MAG: hypothetical protein ACK5SJ_06865 [Bacteroidota bacterium]